MLWDAALGYMLVQDAVYALKSISTYDSISHAYEMLDAAMRQIAGKGSGLPKSMIYNTKERNAYGYITTKTAMQEKEEKLAGFFDELVATGDIDACIANSLNPGAREGQLRGVYSGSTPMGALDFQTRKLVEYARRLASVADPSAQDFSLDSNLDALMDIRPPEDQ